MNRKVTKLAVEFGPCLEAGLVAGVIIVVVFIAGLIAKFFLNAN